MDLIENELDRWHRDGFLHLPNLLSGVARRRIRRWVAAANGDDLLTPLPDRAHGLSAYSAADLAGRHAGLSRMLERGLLPDIASQLVGTPVRPADTQDNPSIGRLTCVLALHEARDEELEVMAGRHFAPEADARGAWQGIRTRPGDLVWLNDLTPRRGHPTQALFLEFRPIATRASSDWSGPARLARA